MSIKLITFVSNKRIRRRRRIFFDYVKLALMRMLHLHPRHSVTLLGHPFYFGDFELLCTLYKEIFILRLYEFDAVSDAPFIIDAGANIGLTALFFKIQYPEAEVICFEPESANFALLKKNVESSGLDGVTLKNAALSDREGVLTLHVQNNIVGGDIGASLIEDYRYAYHSQANISPQTVPTERLSKYVDREVDLLKIDVEGSEGRIFEELADRFSRIRNVNMEYHYIPEHNPLSRILSILEKNNHHYGVDSQMSESLGKTYTQWIKSTRREPKPD